MNGQEDATNYSDASLLFDIGIEEALAGLDKVPKDELQANIDSIVQRINALEKTVTAKISILPAFDARMCMEARLTASLPRQGIGRESAVQWMEEKALTSFFTCGLIGNQVYVGETRSVTGETRP